MRPKLSTKVGHAQKESDGNTDCNKKTVAFSLIPAFFLEGKLAAEKGIFMMSSLSPFVIRWHREIFFVIRNY